MTKRTEGPWEFFEGKDNTFDDVNEQYIAGSIMANNFYIARIWKDSPNYEADARFIVTACNCHDELVAALKAASIFIRNGIELGFIRMPDKETPDPAHLVPGIIETAIAKAEGVKEADHE